MSQLKKEFQEKDVQRLRNLVQGKYGEKTHSSVGFSKADDFHAEGDIWESDGRTWTIKEGIKQNITKLDKAKKAHTMPLFCPKCKKVMKNRYDKTYYNLHKICFNCVIDYEHELKKEGKWEEYQLGIKNNELDNRIKEFKLWVQEKLEESNNSFISEDGDMEKWVGKIDKDKVKQYVKEVEEYLTSLKQ
jgi:hypothetical protein